MEGILYKDFSRLMYATSVSPSQKTKRVGLIFFALDSLLLLAIYSSIIECNLSFESSMIGMESNLPCKYAFSRFIVSRKSL